MQITASKRINALPAYAFKTIDDKVAELAAQGAEPIDLGVGDPTTPTPDVIRARCRSAIDERSTAGYPSYIGSLEMREAVATWSLRRFGVELDPKTEVSTTIGSKEAIFNFAEAFVDPGDVVLIPSPGYPPYSRGTLFAEGRPWFYPLDRENGFLPRLDDIPADVTHAAKALWINYPNSPSGVCPDRAELAKLVAWAQKNDIILASDEAYSEIYFGDAPPPSALEISKDGVVVFNSLSKCSAMTCYRVGWVAGDPRIIEIYRKLKTNIDSGAPTFIQDGAVAALEDDGHKEAMRAEYRQKRDILCAALEGIGMPPCRPEGTVFLWQKAPSDMTSMAFAEALMAPEVGLVTIPGSLLAEPVAGGRNPGEGYVRMSLTPPLETIREAASRLEKLRLESA